ncbi:MAG: S8 family serine peptidase [Planctomycetota bacterium]
MNVARSPLASTVVALLGASGMLVAQDAVPGQVVFKVRAAAIDTLPARLDALGLPPRADAPLAPRRADRIGVGRIRRLRVTPGTERQAAEQLAAAPFVEWAEPLRRDGGATGSIQPNDPAFSTQWSFDSRYTGIDMDMPEAWDLRGTFKVDSDLVVAITDTGWDFNLVHSDVDNVLWTNAGEIPGNGLDDDGNGFVDDVFGYDFADDDGDPQSGYEHGTWVGSIVVAHTDNGDGIAGVADGARALTAKMLDDTGGFPTGGRFAGHLSGAAGIIYSVDQGAQVINCSWGVGTQPAMVINDAIDYAVANGVHVVVAAGNSGISQAWPGEHEDVIAVTGITASGNRSQWCSFIGCQSATFGPWVDLSGGANSVPTIGSGIRYPWISVPFNGTSAAAPQVAGVAAHILSEDRDLSVWDLRTLLMDSAVSVDQFNPGFEGLMGAGHVNARAALEQLEPVTDLGGGLSGNSTPVLNAWGGTTAGSRLTFSAHNAPATAPGALVLGASAAQLPVLGGVLIPSPDLVAPLATDTDGAARVRLTLPATLPSGAGLWLQFAALDGGAAQGVALSNAVLVRG